jgi:hypothetical protein
MIDCTAGSPHSRTARQDFDGDLSRQEGGCATNLATPCVAAAAGLKSRTGRGVSRRTLANSMTLTRLLAIAAIVGTLACDDDPVTDPFAPLALKLTLTPENATLVLGSLSGSGSVQLVPSATSLGLPVVMPPGRVFTTSDSAIAIVDQGGKVIATGLGTTEIVVRVNSERGRATITVVPP